MRTFRSLPLLFLALAPAGALAQDDAIVADRPGFMFTADDPVYQLNAAFEWTFAEAWGLSALAGYLNGPDDGDRYGQETFGVSLGRPFPREAWSFYGEAVHITTDLDEAGDVSSSAPASNFSPPTMSSSTFPSTAA